MRIARYEAIRGESAPRGYGLAYRRFDMDVSIYYPIPFNLIVAFFREVWFWIAFKHIRLQREGFNKGYMKGYGEGVKRGKRDIEESNQLDKILAKVRKKVAK